MTELRDSSVLVTGAASGMGRLLAEKIGARGARLVLWDRDEPRLRDFAAELESREHDVAVHGCDLSSRVDIENTAERVLAEQGPVDVLVNNAGIVTGKPLLRASAEEIERTFAVNTLAHFWTVRAFLPSMLERGHGHLVTIASAAGLVGTPRLTDYSASKFAVVGLDEALRLELAREEHDIETTVVCPFYVATGMFEGVKTRFPRLLPILEPDEVADKIVRAIVRNKPRLVMPRFVYAALLLRLFPVKWHDRLLHFFGITSSMDDFVGRAPSGRRPYRVIAGAAR